MTPILDPRAQADPARVTRILAVKVHDQLGDFLLCTPALRALCLRYPRARIALVTREMLAPLARPNPDVHAVWVMPKVRSPFGLGELLGTLAATMTWRPDLAFVLNSVSRSKTADGLARLSGARLIVGRSRVGAGPLPADAPAEPFAAARAGDRVYRLDLDVARGSEHQVDRYLDLVRWTGAQPDDTGMRLEVNDREVEEIRSILEAAVPPGSRGPWVGLHPGAANPLKCWPLESFVELGASLAAARVRLAVFDSPREEGRAAALHQGLARRGVPAAFVPADRIERFAHACAALELLVCNDSGVMHIAAALGVATVSFHSLGRPAEWAPRGPRAVALWADHAIETIPVTAALEAASRLLRERAPAHHAGTR